jgi:hypothetical protein
LRLVSISECAGHSAICIPKLDELGRAKPS